jgi:hypothetical protein
MDLITDDECRGDLNKALDEAWAQLISELCQLEVLPAETDDLPRIHY